jgi:hypothetical protein
MKQITTILAVLVSFTMSAQLSSVTENSKTGQRLTVSNAANHGDIGSNAVDLSYSNSSSTTIGATGNYSIAMGYEPTASHDASTAIGSSTVASGWASTAMGLSTTASNSFSTSMGKYTQASGNASTAMGESTTASGEQSTSMGKNTTASGSRSTAMGYNTSASGPYSTAMGYGSSATGANTTAIGYYSTASNYGSTAMGLYTKATADYSTAMGYGSYAYADYSTAMGNATVANGRISTTMGNNTSSYDYASLSIGSYNSVNSSVTGSATAFNTANAAFVIGNGTASNAKSDAFVVYFNGNATLAGDLTINSDARLKDNIQPLGSTLDKLHQIEGKTYTFLKDEEHTPKIGVLAQEVQAVFPELVTEGADGILSVNYQGLVPVLINAINEQDTKIATLEAQNEQLAIASQKIEALEEMVRFLAVQQSQAASSVASN